MRSLGSVLAETYASWLQSISQCCPPLASRRDEKPRPRAEKPNAVFGDQPGLVPPPSAEPLWPSERGYGAEQTTRDRSSSKGSRFSVRRRFFSNTSSRRPHISAPTNFRHVYSESFQFPEPQHRLWPASFRPLELSIYMPDNHLSPILPVFDYADQSITPPPPAHTQAPTWDDNSVTLTHERSNSSMSFHLPRRPLHEESSFSSSADTTPPRIPPRSVARTRPRAYTSPSVERIVERIASAMIEKELLQAEIDSVIDRQSVYMSSRPSTAHGMQGTPGPGLLEPVPRITGEDLEPMPSIPAMPAAAPSFAERLSTEGRPHTAPSHPIHVRRREDTIAESPTAFISQHKQVRDGLDRPLAPPLPLVLRPPLRKKKSFSRVSNWLFPATEHQRDISLESITNRPKPVTGNEGFYQCVGTPEAAGRTSLDTVSSVSTVSTWETEEERQTIPTTWSPGSSPVMEQDTPASRPQAIDRSATFGRSTDIYRLQSVGVAF